MLISKKLPKGFTIVELLIVIIVIAILATLVITAYNGVQAKARDVKREADIKSVQKTVELYYAENGSYPSTGSLDTVRTATGCSYGSQQADWVPDVTPTFINGLPQTVKGKRDGCYAYSSDGKNYIITAWNLVETGPQTSIMYHRLGFRELLYFSANLYICNHHGYIGGQKSDGSYVASQDYYKNSYTVSNITSCDEAPPSWVTD